MGPEQLIPSAVAKTADAALEEGKGLIRELLGPMFRAMGADLASWYQGCQAERRANAQKIMDRSVEILGERLEEPGSIHPRVLIGALDSGSWSGDELSAQYYGGVLASSKSGVPRDDRGVSMVELVKSLSVYELRIHYIVYRAVYELLRGSGLNVTLGVHQPNMRVFLPDSEFIAAMEFEQAEEPSPLMVSSVISLVSRDLLQEVHAIGAPTTLSSVWAGATAPGFVVGPTPRGTELFLWAHGRSDVISQHFLAPGLELSLEESIPTVPNAVAIAKS